MLPENYISNWQSTMNVLAEIFNVPEALIMVIEGKHLEVFVSSNSNGNPYSKGDNDVYDGSGLYCERVIKTNDKLLVPNALKDTKWKDNPDIKHGLISYLGFPLVWPTGETFGTICVLDRNENSYSDTYIKLLDEFKKHIELDLSFFEKNVKLEKALDEVKALQGIIPICSYCHSIRDDEGAWSQLDTYISQHSNAQFSHGVCPKCLPKARSEAGLDEE